MIEFTFRVTLTYKDARAFLDVSLERAHERVAENIKETLEVDPYFHTVSIEVEPV